MKRLCLALIVLVFAAGNVWAGFGYYSPITIDHTLVPSTQTDFPVLISVTDTRLKTVGNGGHVENAYPH